MILALKQDKPIPVYRIFLSGPGGVGKSHIFKLVHYESMQLLKPLDGYFKPDDIAEILSAFTRTADFWNGWDGFAFCNELHCLSEEQRRNIRH